MPYGYHGKILHVDLTSGALEVEQPDEAFYRLYMGGSALGLYYLLHETPAGVDPLGPDNTLILALSVLTGAPISGQSRMTAVAKSPLTEAVGDSAGGRRLRSICGSRQESPKSVRPNTCGGR
jgi:aldehyde:ferredoxin oxidoreductase